MEYWLVFFFQAEDGIRDLTVTGVQTCALPILSGPLLDRIDIHLEVPAVKYRALSDQGSGEPSEPIRERADRARAGQRDRFAARARSPPSRIRPRGPPPPRSRGPRVH